MSEPEILKVLMMHMSKNNKDELVLEEASSMPMINPEEDELSKSLEVAKES